MPDIVTCAIYARYSTNNQREASIDDQVRKCRETALAKGWQVLDRYVYFDKARSGTASVSRDAFKEMMRIAMSGNCPFQRILVDDTSRVARNTREALDVFSLLSFYGVHVYYVAQNIDTSHETAEEMITINGLIDSLYIRNLAKETHRGMEGQVLKGFSAGGRRYGYRSEPVYSGKVDIYGNPEADGYLLKINVDEADTIIRIYSMFGEQGYSARKIVHCLNKELLDTEKPRPPRGQFWSVITLLGSKKRFRGILNNEIYIGKYYWNRSKSKKNPETGTNRVFTKPSSNWLIQERPNLRIISDELWMKVKSRQRQISSIAGGRYVSGKSLYSRNLLTGLATCKRCEGNIVIISGGKYGKYGCSNNWNHGDSVCTNRSKIDKSFLEKFVLQRVKFDSSDEHIVEALMRKVNNLVRENISRKTADWRGDSIEAQLVKIKKEVRNLLNAISAGVLSDAVKSRLRDGEDKIQTLENQMMVASSTTRAVTLVTHSMVKQYLSDIYQLCSLHPVLGKTLLSLLIQRIYVDDQPGSTVLIEFRSEAHAEELRFAPETDARPNSPARNHEELLQTAAC